MKHAILLELLARLTAEPGSLTVIDTHAGAGLYDLKGGMARRSGEASAGVERLMAAEGAPAALGSLKAVVRVLNEGGALHLYPGSPMLAVHALRQGDVYRGYELREEDHQSLGAVLTGEAGRRTAQAIFGDGYAVLNTLSAKDRTLVLIDPPFEQGDEHDRIALGVGAALRRHPRCVVAVWTPLKDLETFDALLRRVEALNPPSLVAAEVRLRPLVNPMKMNGCAMLVIGAPDIESAAGGICQWTAANCSPDPALASARVRRL